MRMQESPGFSKSDRVKSCVHFVQCVRVLSVHTCPTSTMCGSAECTHVFYSYSVWECWVYTRVLFVQCVGVLCVHTCPTRTVCGSAECTHVSYSNSVWEWWVYNLFSNKNIAHVFKSHETNQTNVTDKMIKTIIEIKLIYYNCASKNYHFRNKWWLQKLQAKAFMKALGQFFIIVLSVYCIRFFGHVYIY